MACLLYSILMVWVSVSLHLTSARVVNEESIETQAIKKVCKISFDSDFTAKSFPPDFLFGAATAAYQVEGAALKDGRGPCIWDEFTKIPGKIADGSNASVTDDSYHKYKKDINLLKSLGVKTYRFSISWSRLLPNGTGYVNPAGIDYYNKLIDHLIDSDIIPAVTLYHWDLPEALHKNFRGWLNSSISEYFVEYAKLAFASYGDRVKTWITFNEPMEISVQGYALGTHAPGRCSNRSLCPKGNSSTEPYLVGHNILRSHAAAVMAYRKLYQPTQGGKIGITIDSQYFFPETNSSVDKIAANQALEFNYGWFADPVIFGDYPSIMKSHAGTRLPKFSPKETKALKGSVDFLGVNSYTGSYASPGSPPVPGQGYVYTDSWVTTNTKNLKGKLIGAKTASAWLLVVPKAIYGLVMWIHHRYGSIPMYITENGTSDRGNASLAEVLCDEHRIKFYESYLKELLLAISDGANVQAYYAWSLLDNFEWARGYTERFGMNYVDFNDPHRPRYPKLSAHWWSYFMNTP